VGLRGFSKYLKYLNIFQDLLDDKVCEDPVQPAIICFEEGIKPLEDHNPETKRF
jgi:hypothetical protein